MPEETKPIPEGVEVAENVIKQGTTQLLTRAALANPAPVKMQRVIKALNYFIVGLMTTVGATDLFTGKQAKIICFILGVVVLALGATELAIGVKPAEENKP